MIWEVGLCMVVIKIFSMIHNIFLVLCKPFFLTFQYEHINILSDGNDRHHIVYILRYTLRIICQHIKWQVYNNRFYAKILEIYFIKWLLVKCPDWTTPRFEYIKKTTFYKSIKPRGYIFVQLRYISPPCNTNLSQFIP